LTKLTKYDLAMILAASVILAMVVVPVMAFNVPEDTEELVSHPFEPCNCTALQEQVNNLTLQVAELENRSIADVTYSESPPITGTTTDLTYHENPPFTGTGSADLTGNSTN
jgi:hypothetical protein